MSAMNPARSNRTLVTRAAGFLALFAALNFAYLTLKKPWLKPVVVDAWTVRPAAWLADALLSVPVRAEAHTLVAGGQRISVLNGCEGVDAMLMLLAAVALAPLRWRDRLWGALAGVALVWGVNQGRIVALVWARLEAPAAFALGHGLVGPLGVIAVAGCWFFVWSTWCTRR